MPGNVKAAGSHYKLPYKDLDKKGADRLVIGLTESDRTNARAVNSCKYYHKKLQSLYKK